MKRIINAFFYSMAGLKAAFKSEVAFRQDCLICLLGTIILFFLNCSRFEKAVLFGTLILILLMELTNTAVETVIDRISPERHDLSKKAKDIGSSLVLLAFINAIVTWVLILS